jgi:hypothetical protein
MGLVKLDVRIPATATPAALYALLRDGATWPVWSPIDSFELDQPAEDEPEGLGAIRIFHTGRHTSVERIVELVPDRRLSYALVRGLPLRGYRADIDLETEGDTTYVHWHSTFTAKVPGTGRLYRRALTGFIQRCATGLAAYAATHADTESR